uniref:Protein SDA1 n=1 Tax=Ditylenchus dipsaci TaxID=166011 RepID=A0A915DYR8_9BILA
MEMSIPTLSSSLLQPKRTGGERIPYNTTFCSATNIDDFGYSGFSASRFKLADGNLGLLQEYLRKDPESYLEEFSEQFHHFVQSMKLLELQPKMHRMGVEQLLEVVNFIASIAFNYPAKAKEFAATLNSCTFVQQCC